MEWDGMGQGIFFLRGGKEKQYSPRCRMFNLGKDYRYILLEPESISYQEREINNQKVGSVVKLAGEQLNVKENSGEASSEINRSICIQALLV